MHYIKHQQLANMAPRYKAQIINSLSGFKSANLLGTRNKNKINNLAIFSSVFHLGASPALAGFISRSNSVERHTLENIKLSKHYTINQVSVNFWQAAESEFNQTGLTRQFIEHVDAPFVAESELKYALRLTEIVPIQHNDTLLVIGEITEILYNKTAIKHDGYIDIESLQTVMISGIAFKLASFENSESLDISTNG